MLVRSDNNAFFVLRRSVSPGELEDAAYHMGVIFPESIRSPSLSPKNYAAIFRSLYYSTYLRLDSAQYLLSLMSMAEHRYGLRSAIPDTVPVAHKIGLYYPPPGWQGPAKDPFLHDVGIIYFPARPFLLSVMTTDLDKKSGAELIQSVARQTYEFYAKHQKEGEKGR